MRRVVFMGTPEFAVPSLKALARLRDQGLIELVGVYSQPDRPVGRGLEMRAPPVKSAALEVGLTVYQPEKLSLPGEWERLKALRPDLVVVVAFGQILKRNVLDLPALGCINVHSSLLPRWRGAGPIARSILAGDQVTGVTIIKLVEKLDAGDMVAAVSTPISESETAATLHDRLSVMGADLLAATVTRAVREGVLRGSPQDESAVTYASKLSKEMERLDPSKEDSRALDRRIRALTPWPGTSIWVRGGGRIRVKSACWVPEVRGGAVGTVFEKDGDLYLGASGGSIRLLQVQWEGKRSVSATEFLNGLKGMKGAKEEGKALPLVVESELKSEGE